MEKTNQSWLYRQTGDPFADIGGLVLKYLLENGPTQDKKLPEIIEWLTNIYVYQWDAKINAFFLNSTITQGVYDTQKKVSKTLEYFNDLFTDMIPGKEGWCRITGQFGKIYPAGRDNQILSGSGTFINFHASFETGLYLSREAIVRIFAVPFGVMQLGDKIGLVYTNIHEANEILVNDVCDRNINDLSSGIGKGVLKSDFTNPTNALFLFAKSLIDNLSDTFEQLHMRPENVQINMLLFTNFGTKPDIELYTMPGRLFQFYSTCLDPKFQPAWKLFILSHHRSSKYKGIQFDAQTQTWTSSKATFGMHEYQNWQNPVYQYLLAARSILGFIQRWSRANLFPFALVEIYLTQLRNMEKQTILVVRRTADFIVGKDADNIKKALVKINSAKYPHQLRSFFTALDIKNYKSGARDPLFKVEEFTEYLFGDTSNWREIRDVLLIAIYEKLHELNKSVEVDDPDDQEDFTETETQN